MYLTVDKRRKPNALCYYNMSYFSFTSSSYMEPKLTDPLCVFYNPLCARP